MVGINNFLVELKSALVDEITIAGGTKLYLAAKYNYEWNVSVTGTVLAVPKNERGIKVGDEIAFSYMVVNDKTWDTLNADKVFALTIDTPNYKEWTAGNGDTIVKEKHPLHKLYVGLLYDSKKDITDTIYDKEEAVDSWLQQFNFQNNIEPVNTNLMKYAGKNIWRVNPQFVFAKKTNTGIVAYNDYVALKPVTEDLTTQVSLVTGVKLPNQSVLSRYKDRGEIVGTTNSSEYQCGEIAAIDQRFIEKYDLWGNELYLVKECNVLGVFKD
jgi:hypothetical protein